MIYTLTMNPAIDLFYSPNDKSAVAKIGGKGINISSFLCELCVDNICAVAVGNDFIGKTVARSLKTERKIDKAEIFFDAAGKSRINFKLKASFGEEEFNGRGYLSPEICREIALFYNKSLKKGDVLICAGSLPAGVDEKFYASLANICGDKEAFCITDCRENVLTEAIKAKPELLRCNLSEAKTQDAARFSENCADAAKALANLTGKSALVTDGEKGFCLCTGKKACFCKAEKLNPVSTVGAGDSVTASLVAGYLRGLRGDELLNFCKSFVGDIITRKL